MKESIFNISKMDCPSEENLIRMKLSDVDGISSLEFSIAERILKVYHGGDVKIIDSKLIELGLGSKLLSSKETEKVVTDENNNQRKLLWYVLIINFSFFLIEMVFGIFSRSMGLVADSLDMLADSFVYMISLIVVGGSLIQKKRVAKAAGYFQIILAGIGFIEVVRRVFWFNETPNYQIMIIVSVFALLANILSLVILQKSKSNEAHMKASMIFTSNDIIINSGVILAGILVYFLNTKIPDLVIGAIVFIIVIRGAIRILKLGR